jgi:hypothetical protein
MYGVMIPDVSAGSNQVGASEMWTAQVSWSCDEAWARRGRPVAKDNAVTARMSRRAIPASPMRTRSPRLAGGESITLLLAALSLEPRRQSRSPTRFCQPTTSDSRAATARAALGSIHDAARHAGATSTVRVSPFSSKMRRSAISDPSRHLDVVMYRMRLTQGSRRFTTGQTVVAARQNWGLLVDRMNGRSPHL